MPIGSRVYWCDSYTDVIESVDLWGNNRMVHLATSSIGPWDLAVVNDSIIWTDRDVAAIGATLTNGSSGYSFYYHNTFQEPRGIHVYREEMPTTTEVYNPTTDQANTEENVTLVVGITQTISSPNYPSNYPNNVRYYWYITAPSGYDVLVQFLSFDLERNYDYLTIGIGESPSSPGSVELARLTGSSLPSDMRLDSSKSWMRFSTDSSVTERGFQLQLSLINSTTATTTESTTTGWWWGWTTSYPGTTDTPRQPNETARLVNGSYPTEGRVEVYSGTWGTVCDHGWNTINAGVLCRSIGYPDALMSYGDAFYGMGSGLILLNHVSCSGHEESLFDCYHSGIGVNHCSHAEDVGVVCYPDVRLVNGNSPSEGRVEVYYDGIWGTVCDHSWYYTNSHVVCRSLGFPGAISYFYDAYFGQGTGPILLNHVSCSGNEESIFDCNHNGVGNNHCNHYDDVGVRCQQNVRLVNGSSPNEGRVEVYHGDTWGTVCDHSFGISEANVICRSLGYSSAEYVFYNAYFGQGSGDILLNHVSCMGNESSIFHCYHNGVGVNYCFHIEDVGVRCTDADSTTISTTTEPPSTDSTSSPIPTEAPSSVRLVNGNEAHEGRVEVFRSGSWGTVCDDYWGTEDARVVCRSLGYQDALSAPQSARFGQGGGPIWMDDVHCSGNEAHIFDCPHNGFGNHDCSHWEDASVVCLPDEADLTCDSVSMTLIMDRTLLEIGDDARDVHFEDESCVGYDHDSQHVAITTMYDRCGTTQEQDDDYIIFTNMVTYYKPRPENGTNELITREHYLHIPVTCYLERTQDLEESFLPETNVYVFEEEGYGEFSLNLDRYTNSGFYQPANDSGEVTLGTPLYFGVHLTAVTNLTLLIESCWATSSPGPRDDHRYDIIENGCAVDSTTVIYNWASPTFKGFSIDAFTFIGDYDKVYVHCSILICDSNDSGSRCAQGCLARSRRSLQPTGSRSKPHTITNGPLSDASRSQRSMLLESVDDGPETHDSLMIFAVSALCVLIALTVIMALMMVRMRRPRPKQIGYRRVGVTEQDY